MGYVYFEIRWDKFRSDSKRLAGFNGESLKKIAGTIGNKPIAAEEGAQE